MKKVVAHLLTLIDECTNKCSAIEVEYNFTSNSILEVLNKIFIKDDIADYIRSDNGSEFIACHLKNG
jgi:hypothetical protein